jgi:hypothetical protein
MARMVTCKGCQASVILYSDEDPHAALNCNPDGNCCLQDHHHGQAAETTGEPCRPVTHLYIGELAAPGTAG